MKNTFSNDNNKVWSVESVGKQFVHFVTSGNLDLYKLSSLQHFQFSSNAFNKGFFPTPFPPFNRSNFFPLGVPKEKKIGLKATLQSSAH